MSLKNPLIGGLVGILVTSQAVAQTSPEFDYSKFSLGYGGNGYYLQYGDVSDNLKAGEFGLTLIHPRKETHELRRNKKGIFCEDRWEVYVKPVHIVQGCLNDLKKQYQEQARFLISRINHDDLRVITFYKDGDVHMRFDLTRWNDHPFHEEQLKKLRSTP